MGRSGLGGSDRVKGFEGLAFMGFSGFFVGLACVGDTDANLTPNNNSPPPPRRRGPQPI